MKKAKLAILLTGVFAVYATASSAGRELLFGPAVDQKEAKIVASEKTPVVSPSSSGVATKTAIPPVAKRIDDKPSKPGSMNGLKMAAMTPPSSDALAPSEKNLPAAKSVAKSMPLMNNPSSSVANSGTPVAVGAVAITGKAPANLAASDAPKTSILTPKVAETAYEKPLIMAKTIDKPVEVTKSIAADMPPQAQSKHANAYDIHKQLISKMDKGMTIAMMPGLTTQTQTYGFNNNANYLSLANYLSEQLGVVVTPRYESNMSELRKIVLSARYPMIHVNTQLVDAATKAGYEPLVMNDLKQGAVFIVKKDSPIKTLADAKGSRIAMIFAGANTPYAQAALIRAGIHTSVKMDNVKAGGQPQVVNLVAVGKDDIGMVNSKDLAGLQEKTKTQLRVIHLEPSDLSWTWWVRKGAFNKDVTAKLAKAMIAINERPDLDEVRNGIKKATNLPVKYAALSESETKKTIENLALINEKWDAFKILDNDFDASIVAKNSASSPYYPVHTEKSTAESPFTEHKKLSSVMTKGTTIGVLPGLSLGQAFSYNNSYNYFPLVNYLSKKMGFLVGPVFEPSVAALRTQIYLRKYPMIHINTQLVEDAVKSDYEPLVMNDLKLSAVFIVKSDSPIKSLKDMGNKVMMMSTSASTSPSAYSALIEAGINDSVKIKGSGAGGLERVVAEVLSGKIDAGMINSSVAKVQVEKANGALRVVHEEPSELSYTYWVRKGAFDDATKKKMQEAFIAVTSQPNLKNVREGIVRATNLPVFYIPMDMSRVKRTVETADLINEKWPEYGVEKVVVSSAASEKNAKTSAFYSLRP